jgi:asparagine synthase (glutamine-hydrolysing)
MSGIAGILNFDGAPVDRELLSGMTELLACRGPDEQAVWAEGAIGFGHAMLRTRFESANERQPCSIDGKVWITADARVDARDELIAALRSRGRECSASAPDPELILHAYAAWDEECVEHLLGDFAFVIWDGRERKLFCARDHFGVKPFYYAQAGNSLIFSNTLNCVRLHLGVSGELNELAIADLLLFDFNQEPDTTTFSDIQRLPPAHTLVWRDGASQVHRYWTLPIEEPIRYKRSEDYVEHFRELFTAAVADRLRTDRVGVLMSGGLDSSSIAAVAQGISTRQYGFFQLRAFTGVFDRLIPHEERRFAGLVAEALRLPIQYQPLDGDSLYQNWEATEIARPEPSHNPRAAAEAERLQGISLHGRVLLTGLGGDPAFSCLMSAHLRKRIESRQFGPAFREVMRYLAAEGRFSRLYLRTRLRRWSSRDDWRSLYPVWLEQHFEKRLNLPGRWERLNRSVPPEHALRPQAYEALIAPMWPELFRGYDPDWTGLALETRHPFFDLRLLQFLLALPALPWCTDKQLLRVAMRGILPEEVRLRRKSPLKQDPTVAEVQRPESKWVDHFEPAPALAQYVVRGRVPRVAGEKDSWYVWVNLRPLSLNKWLQSVSPIHYIRPRDSKCKHTATQGAEETL